MNEKKLSILIFLFSLIIGIMVGEIILATVTSDSQPICIFRPHSLNGFVTQTNQTIKHQTSEFDYFIQLNSLGLRDQEPDPSISSIIILGDSFPFGIGVNEEQTFPSLLEQKTGQSFLNHGIPGYGPIQEIRYYYETNAFYPHDFVLLTIYVGNDLQDNYNLDLLPNEKGCLVSSEQSNEWFNRFNQLHITQTSKRMIRSFFPKKEESQSLPFIDEQKKLKLVKDLTQFNDYLTIHQKRFGIIIIPDDETTQFLSTSLYTPPIYSLLYNLSVDQNITLFDPTFLLSDAMQNEEVVYYPQNKHFTEKGHEIVADFLVLSLKKEGWIK